VIYATVLSIGGISKSLTLFYRVLELYMILHYDIDSSLRNLDLRRACAAPLPPQRPAAAGNGQPQRATIRICCCACLAASYYNTL